SSKHSRRRRSARSARHWSMRGPVITASWIPRNSLRSSSSWARAVSRSGLPRALPALTCQPISHRQSTLWLNVFDRSLYLGAAQDLRPNAGQWDAYNSKGHCVVLAGPGSGKTKTLTIKLARMLAEDVEEPRGIACVTYNTECARELEQRLAALGV